MSEQQAYAREESYAERQNQRIRELKVLSEQQHKLLLELDGDIDDLKARIQKAREILEAVLPEHVMCTFAGLRADIRRALAALEGK